MHSSVVSTTASVPGCNASAKALYSDSSQALQGDLCSGSDGRVPSLQLRAEQVHARMQRGVHLRSCLQVLGPDSQT